MLIIAMMIYFSEFQWTQNNFVETIWFKNSYRNENAKDIEQNTDTDTSHKGALVWNKELIQYDPSDTKFVNQKYMYVT
jgi:hypothetical protein